MVYSPSGIKHYGLGITAPMEYVLMAHNPMKKAWFCERVFFRRGDRHGKR